MAEEFTLSVDVDANMSKFRQTLRAELEAAQRQGATIPVGATGGAAAASAVVPPGAASATTSAGVAYTAATVAQQSAQAVATAAARAGLPSPMFGGAPGGFMHAGGMVGPAAGLAFAGNFPVPASPMPVPAGARGMPAGTPQVPPPIPIPLPGRGRRGSFGGFGGRRGFIAGGEGVTGAYLLNAAGRMFEAGLEHGAAERMAMGDPEGLIEADLAYQQSIADAFPIAGRIGASAREYVTGEREALATVRGQTEQQAGRIGRMRDLAERQMRARELVSVSELRGSARQVRLVENEYLQTTRDIDQRQRAALDVEGSKYSARRTVAEEEYSVAMRDVNTGMVGGPGGGVNAGVMDARRTAIEARRDSQLQIIQKEQDNAVRLAREGFGPERTAAASARDREINDLTRGVRIRDFIARSDAEGATLRAQNNRFGAEMHEQWSATMIGMAQADTGSQRFNILRGGVAGMAGTFMDTLRDSMTRRGRDRFDQRSMQARLERDPLQATLEEIRGETYDEEAAAQDLAPFERDAAVKRARGRGAAREALARQENDDARQLRLQSLDNRREHYDLLAEGKPLSARATDIKRQTEEDVASMRQSKQFTAEEIKKRIEGGISEAKAFEFELKRRMNSGFGMEAAPFSMGPGHAAGNQVEPVVNGLKEVKKAIEDLKAWFAGGN